MKKVIDERIILVINCGSSSLKYEVYGMPGRNSLGRGQVERIGDKGGRLTQECINGRIERTVAVPDHGAAMRELASALTDEHNGVVEDISAIAAVGHRVVHGGERYAQSVLIDEDVVAAINEFTELAPLHNPANLTGITEAQTLLPEAPQVAVFDTAFHQTIPPAAFLYGLPRDLYEKYKIRRYGFHGTSHRYVAETAMRYCKRSPENTNVISCHLGNGASITAIRNGRSVDTSMGFTPLEGLMMGTRSGDIDPAIPLYLMERGFSAADLNEMLNRKSGLLGLSRLSNDLRDLEEAAELGNRDAQDALDAYAHRVRHYIGAYAANLVKVDILVFTGGIGQYGTRMRERICSRMENIGIALDFRRNLENGPREGIISADYSPITIVVTPTNEELQIALDTDRIAFGS